MEKKEKTNQAAELADRLKKFIAGNPANEGIAEELQTRSDFYQYSLRNCMLMLMQFPTVSKVASYRKWQELGRQVKKGEKGIKILVPLFRKKANSEDADEEPEKLFYACKVGNVFDIAQTEAI